MSSESISYVRMFFRQEKMATNNGNKTDLQWKKRTTVHTGSHSWFWLKRKGEKMTTGLMKRRMERNFQLNPRQEVHSECDSETNTTIEFIRVLKKLYMTVTVREWMKGNKQKGGKEVTGLHHHHYRWSWRWRDTFCSKNSKTLFLFFSPWFSSSFSIYFLFLSLSVTLCFSSQLKEKKKKKSLPTIFVSVVFSVHVDDLVFLFLSSAFCEYNEMDKRALVLSLLMICLIRASHQESDFN